MGPPVFQISWCAGSLIAVTGSTIVVPQQPAFKKRTSDEFVVPRTNHGSWDGLLAVEGYAVGRGTRRLHRARRRSEDGRGIAPGTRPPHARCSRFLRHTGRASFPRPRWRRTAGKVPQHAGDGAVS